MLSKEELIESYKAFYQQHDRVPNSTEEFENYLGNDSMETLQSFNPLLTLRTHIWESYFFKALERCQADPQFEHYACREIYLSMLYNIVGVLNEEAKLNKEMISFNKSLPSIPKELKRMKAAAADFYKQMISAGQNSGEIADRNLVNFQYNKWCWYGTLFVIFFWKKDSSEHSEQTDVAIEKVAHLIFDILNPNALDSSLEFFTFLFKQGFK